jgi:hypothetical protein
MIARRQYGRAIVVISDEDLIARGETAGIYGIRGEPSLAAKIYHCPGTEDVEKLTAMLVSPPDEPEAHRVSFAWPIDILTSPDLSHRPIGFLMPRVAGTCRLADVYLPERRLGQSPGADFLQLVRIAASLSAGLEAIHAAGYVVGDLSESDILYTAGRRLWFVDTDSYQAPSLSGAIYPCRAGRPEFAPPEMSEADFARGDRRQEQDLFALGSLVFRILMEGRHPFGDERLCAQELAATTGRANGRRYPAFGPDGIEPDIEDLDPDLARLFVRCFVSGRENPSQRPTAGEWRRALDETENPLGCCDEGERRPYFPLAVVSSRREGRGQKGSPGPFPPAEPGGRLAMAMAEAVSPLEASVAAFESPLPALSVRTKAMRSAIATRHGGDLPIAVMSEACVPAGNGAHRAETLRSMSVAGDNVHCAIAAPNGRSRGRAVPVTVDHIRYAIATVIVGLLATLLALLLRSL